MEAVLHMEVDATPLRGSRSTAGAGPGSVAGGTTTTLLRRARNSRAVPNRSEPNRSEPDRPRRTGPARRHHD
ncbi:hypothetical protein ADL25_07635 [Streptomyces sp. NRRL F-5122]|nr:hypothetical protein ADL25_07635 [Streptomyces sp. NRRL F-5122]